MPVTLPLIRAGGVLPFVRWIEAARLPLETRLAQAGLGAFPWDALHKPLPLHHALRFVVLVAEREGIPDLGCRAASPDTVADFGALGVGMLRSRTPREALLRATELATTHCSALRVRLGDGIVGPVLRARLVGGYEPRSLHLAHQQIAMIVATFLGRIAPPAGVVRRIAMAPDPVLGTAHLRDWFGDVVVSSPDDTLVMEFDGATLERALPSPRRAGAVDEPTPLPDLGRLADSVRAVIDWMLVDRTPSVHDLAVAADTSVRSLQRALAVEGIRFRALLDEVRHERALAALRDGEHTIGRVASDLGYASQACLSHAMRRWEGTTPQTVRRRRSSSH